MLRVLSILSLCISAEAAGRASVDLLGKCTDGDTEVWNVVDRRGDGSSAVQLTAYGVCLGVPNLPNARKLPVITDVCDGAKTRLWSASSSIGRIRDSATGACLNAMGSAVNQSACGSTITYAVSNGDALSASSGNARLALDADPETPWLSAGGYDGSGAPLVGSPVTVVANSTVVGQWVQVAISGMPVTVASYAIRFTSQPWPSLRRRPRGHVLLASQNATGPWTTVGRVDDSPFVPLASVANFTSMSMQAFSVYRLVVTRVHRMGDGSAEVGELVLVTDPQRFAIAEPVTSAAAAVRWTVASIDPWAPLRATVTQQARITPAFVATVYNASASGTARYAAGIAALDVVASSGVSTVVDARTLVNGSDMTIPAGIPSLGSGVWTLVVSMQFSAPDGFTNVLSVSRSSGSAALIVYDLSADSAVALTAGMSAPVSFINSHVYNILVVMSGGTAEPAVAGGVGALAASVHSATLARRSSITPTAFSPGKPPTYSGARCANPYFSTMSF